MINHHLYCWACCWHDTDELTACRETGGGRGCGCASPIPPQVCFLLKIINYISLNLQTTYRLPLWHNKEGVALLVASRIHLKQSHTPSLAQNVRWRGPFVLYPLHLPTHCFHRLSSHWTSKKCPDGHGFYVQRVSAIPNIEIVPIWACCQCLVFLYHLSHAKYQNHAHLWYWVCVDHSEHRNCAYLGICYVSVSLERTCTIGDTVQLNLWWGSELARIKDEVDVDVGDEVMLTDLPEC